MLSELRLPPILVFTIALMAGIILADLFRPGFTLSLILFLCGIAIYLIATMKNLLLRFVSSALMFLLLGMLLTSLAAAKLDAGLLYKYARESSYVTVEGRLVSDPKLQNGVSSFDLEVGKLSVGDKSWLINEKLKAKIRSRDRIRLYMGQGVRISGHLELPKSDGDLNYRWYLYHKGITSILVASSEDINRADNAFSLMSFAGSIRHWIKERNMSRLPVDQAALLNGIILGDDSDIPEDVGDSFRATGLTHILAASGMNIALVLTALWPLLRLLRLHAKWQYFILVLAAALYTLVSGMSPSISRAFLMATIALTAWVIGREGNIIASLSAAAMIILIADPLILYDIGFQLSFAATAFLISFVPVFDGMIDVLPRPLRSALSVAFAAQIGVIPLIAYYFGQLSAISLIANLVVVPLAGPVLILGMAVLPVDSIAPYLAKPAYTLLSVMLRAMILGAKILFKYPSATLYLNQPSLGTVIIYYIVIACIYVYIRKLNLKLRLSNVIIIIAIISLAPICWQIARSVSSSEFEVTFLDVGQGDSAIVSGPDGSVILIDSGPNPGIIKRKLDQRGIKKIDAIIVTHAHSDHLGALDRLIDSYNIGGILYPAGIDRTRALSIILSSAKRKGIKCTSLDTGDILHVGSCLEVDILYAGADGEENDNSAVTMIKYSKLSLLFTGDAGGEIERQLIQERKSIDADILKVGHHGSSVSSTRDFLCAVTPCISVISVGRNNMYGHPARSTIDRLLDVGSKIYRTDRNGDVTIKSDGNAYQVYVEKE